MAEDSPEKRHESFALQKGSKMLPPSLPTSSPSLPPKDIFSSKRHSMNYVTVDGVKLRTGYSNKRDWYFLCFKELFDNAVDFLWGKYQGASDAYIDVHIERTSDSLLHVKIKNSNPKNIEAFTLEKLNLIFDFDMTAGSKQNLHIISRGVLGDAMKQVLALPYVLIHAHDDGTTFANRQWEHPLIIRSNGKEFYIPLYVDLANQIILASPIKEINLKTATNTDTEIEVVLPIIDEVRKYLDIHTIEQYCKEYPIFTTDISFRVKLVDNTLDEPTPVEKSLFDSTKKEWVTEVANVLTSPARKAAIKIDYPALHPITEKWNNKASVHSYKQGEFVTFIESVYDKSNTTIYQRIKQLRESTNIKVTPDLEISIADLIADKNKVRKEESLFWQLRALLPAPEKLSLPYTNVVQRKDALVKRIARLHEGRLDTKAAVYKIIDGFYKNDIIAYPFVFEIIVITYNDTSINNNEYWLRSNFKGSVNYSVSPQGNFFEGNYKWDDPKKTTEFSEPHAWNAQEILEVYSFKFYKHSDARTKLPCVIFANLVTPRVDYHGADKSRIDTTPFTDTIIKACRKAANDIQTFKAAGYEFQTKSSRTFTPVREKKKTIDDVIKELLGGWM